MQYLKCFLILCCLSLIFSSCDRTRVYEQNTLIEKNTWPQKVKYQFDVPISDSAQAYDLYVNVRNSGKYQYSNLFLFVTMSFPDGSKTRDTLECTLADPSGKWLGDGLGDLHDNQKLFKEKLRFPHTGNYHFQIEQAMRIDPLQGITDIGLRVEKANNY